MKHVASLLAVIVAALAGQHADSNAVAADRQTVRDAMWIWAQSEGAYNKGVDNNTWGLPGDSSITPVEGAKWIGVPNIIMIRYNGKPQPPFDQYAVPFRTMNKVMWSIAGESGRTAEQRLDAQRERDGAFALAAKMPNISGVFLDDFFGFDATMPPQWLADDYVHFPILLTIRFPAPVAVDRLELVQSDLKIGNHRSGPFAVDVSSDSVGFKEVAQGTMPKVCGAAIGVALPRTEVRAVRIRILGTHDVDKVRTCGLRQVRLWQGDKCLDLKKCSVQASSHFPGYEAENVLADDAYKVLPAPAAMSVEQLQQLRPRLTVSGRKLDLGVTLYTFQLDERIIPHLKSFDIVSLWTWEAADLAKLEKNLDKFQAIAPGKRVSLGLYMWDFSGKGQPVPLDLMKKQCNLALKWLREGRIEGMIFLATNLCDLNLEAVKWSRSWIAEVGSQRLDPLRHK